jgi:succinylglutamate desuccinylase
MISGRVKRVIGTFDDGVPGPLIIALCCLHGNERAGYKAIDFVLKMLEVEHITQPDFIYKGRFVGLCGNLEATRRGERYVDEDLNRLWTEELIERLNNRQYIPRSHEEKELQALWYAIRREVKQYNTPDVIILDFHTTSAEGGIFCLPASDAQSMRLAFDLYIPVVHGLMDKIPNSCLSYMTEEHLGKKCRAMSIEVGQHEDPASVYVAIAAMINCMRCVGAVHKDDVESRHDTLLSNYSRGLPRVSNLIYRHTIEYEDSFKMEPGFRNFQPVEKGVILANDKNGSITCPKSGAILMPLYQSRGRDGFFLVQKDEDYGYF